MSWLVTVVVVEKRVSPGMSPGSNYLEDRAFKDDFGK